MSLLTPLTAAMQTRLTDHNDDCVNEPGIVGTRAIHGLLPCPLLYPAFLSGFAQASAADDALSLAALGVETVPSLFLYGTLFQSVSMPTRLRLHRGLGVAFMLLGSMPLWHALVRLGVSLPGVPVPIHQLLRPVGRWIVSFKRPGRVPLTPGRGSDETSCMVIILGLIR